MKPVVALIAAVGPDRVIGEMGRLPWQLPRDLRFFRRTTLNHTVVMGRKTFESFGRKPLPKRRNIVVSRNPTFTASGCDVAQSLQAALNIAADAKKVFVIGGGQLYEAAMPFADEIILTEIENRNPSLPLFEFLRGDVFFPPIDEREWKLVREGKREHVASNRKVPTDQAKKAGLVYRIRRWERRARSQIAT